MAYAIDYSPDAISHLDALRRFDQVRISVAIEKVLRDDPLVPSRRRKQMRSNLISAWELRISNFRAYYDVDETRSIVFVRAIGVKVHNRVLIGGEEVELS